MMMKAALDLPFLRLALSAALAPAWLSLSAAQEETPIDPESEDVNVEVIEDPAETLAPEELLPPVEDPDDGAVSVSDDPPSAPVADPLELPSVVAPGEVALMPPTAEEGLGPDGLLFPANYDLALKDGRILSGARIQGKTASGLMVFHETGASDIPAFLLPDGLVKAYQLDVAASRKVLAALRAEEAKKAKAKLAAQREKKELRSLPSVAVEGTVQSVHEGGIVVDCPDPSDLEEQGLQRIGGMIQTINGTVPPAYQDRIFGTLWVTGHPAQESVVDGDRLIFRAKITGRHQEGSQTYRAVSFERAGTQ